MKRIMLLLALLCYAAGASAQQEMLLDVGDGVVIRGTLLVPEGVAKPPVVLIIAGSGPTDRDGNNPQMRNNSLKNLAGDLQAAGIASFRYDKRGIAASAYTGMREEDVTLDTFADDARKLADMLHSDGRFSGIVLVGHSEGARLAMMAAAGNPAVSKVVSIAGAGRPMDEILIEQLERNPNNPAFLIEESKAILARLKKGEFAEDVNPLLASLFRPSVQPFLISSLRRDPAADIAALTVPVLIVQGGTDIQVTKADMERLTQACPDAETLYIEDMNHVLKRAESTDMAQQMRFYTDPSIPNHEALTPAVAAFVKGK